MKYFNLNQFGGTLNYPTILVPPLQLTDIVGKKGWDVIGSSKAKNLDKRWKKLLITKTNTYLQRLDLVKEQMIAMLNALEAYDE